MTRQTLIRTCSVCGGPRWQKHAETCTGTAPPPKCECPPGMQHKPDCVEVTG